MTPMKFSSRATAVTLAAGTSWELSDRAAQMAAAGEDVILLTVGDVDRDTPTVVVEAMIASVRAGRTHYGPIAGDPSLRSVIARSCSARLGRTVSQEQVVIFPGAQCALFSVMQCLAGSGDEVVLLEPSYATYEPVVAASGADVVRVSLRNGAAFDLDVERIASAITPRCRVVLVNSPNNPCGAVFSKDALDRLVALCAERGVWLVSDEVYGRLTFDAPHVSPASLPAAQDCVVVIDSLSKTHAMTGWRIGWAMGPQALANHLIGFAQAQLFSSPPFIQDAAVVALERETAVTEALRRTYLRRRDVLIEGLRDCPGPASVRPTRRHVRARGCFWHRLQLSEIRRGAACTRARRRHRRRRLRRECGGHGARRPDAAGRENSRGMRSHSPLRRSDPINLTAG